jgi:uncharacterized protein YidB (DUF937 family)
MGALDDLFPDATEKDHASKVSGPLAELLGNGGINDVLGKLGGSGFGDTVKSWIGKGANLPISADQIKSALGSGPLAALAAKAGISSDQVSSVLAKLLPHAVDQATPDGKAPAPDTKVDAAAFHNIFKR